MNKTGEITIVVSCDSHYLVLLAVMLKSVELNFPRPEIINIYIVEDGISEPDRLKLLESVDSGLFRFFWINMNDGIPANLELPLDKSSYPLNIYMRIFIPYFIPEEIEKVLYLDVDMIVRKDIGTVFHTDLGDNIIGAVTDARVKTFDNSWGGVRNYKELGIDGQTKYFNTGLLLINISKWRESGITEKIIKCINDNKWYANYPDQYGLNVVLADQWLELDARWNHFANIGNSEPFIIHFVERKPIFRSYNNDPEYRDIFFHYLKKTHWKNSKPVGETERYIKKISNILEKIAVLLSRFFKKIKPGLH